MLKLVRFSTASCSDTKDMQFLALAIDLIVRVLNRARGVLMRTRFASCGKHVRVDPRGLFTYETISIASHVFVAPGAIFSASKSFIRIGNHVMFGPNVTIIGGNHNVSEVGRFMMDVVEKKPCDDKGVVIEDDVWVGAGATLLSGVIIARGSIVAAGAVVTENFPPYSVIGGVPAKLLRSRWDKETIKIHEMILYSENRVPRAK